MTIFTGNISKAAETRTVNAAGVPTLVTDFNIAENYRGRDGSNNTQFYRVSMWREKGAKLKRYLSQGRSLTLTGRVKGHGYLTQEIVDQIKAGADWRKIKIPCQLEMSDPQITFNTANPTEEVDGVTEVYDGEEVEE